MFACLHLPGFEVAASLWDQPTWQSEPCAIVADSSRPEDPKAPLSSVNPAAARHGIRAGESCVRARIRCPRLRILPRMPAAEEKLAHKLFTIAESLSPDCERHAADTLILDLAGCRPPAIWNPDIPSLRLVMATTPDLAHLGAMADRPFSPRPMDAEDFTPLPLSLLKDAGFSGSTALISLLQLWGLRTLGELRQLPRQELAERAGPEALRIHDLLHGRFARLLKLHRSIESFEQIVCFEHSIESLEALIFQANRMLQTLCSRLLASHLAAASLRFELSFESGPPLSRHLNLPEPRNSPGGLLAPLHTMFESLQAPSGIVSLTLGLEPVKPAAAQREWLGRQLSQPERWPDTLARLQGLLGQDRVGIPRPAAGHRPDDFTVRPVSHGGEPALSSDELPACALPLRRFRPPLKTAVAHSGQGLRTQPLALLTGPHAGSIRRTRGPFPVSGAWWHTPSSWRRIEWDIELENRRLFRLALLPSDDWRIEGEY